MSSHENQTPQNVGQKVNIAQCGRSIKDSKRPTSQLQNNHRWPNMAQHSASSGPPPLITFLKPFFRRNSRAFWPRPPPPQWVITALPAGMHCKSSAPVARSMGAEIARGRSAEGGRGPRVTDGSAEEGSRTSTTTAVGCEVRKLAISAGEATPGLRNVAIVRMNAWLA